MKVLTILSVAGSVMAGCVFGWLAHNPTTVNAATDSDPVSFQMQGSGPATQLGVYYANEHDLYVYPGVTAGSSSVNCAYKLHIPRAGGPIERSNCGVGKVQ